MQSPTGGCTVRQPEVDTVVTTSVFYDPQNRQITVATDDVKSISMLKEEDGTTLITFEDVDEIEFYWPDERLWRAI